MNKTGKGGTQRGKPSRNPSGRPALLPELRALGEEQRNVVKATLAILLKMDDRAFEKHSRSVVTKAERILIKCIERIENDGDIRAARDLLEILTGKLVDETTVQEISEDDRAILARFRVLDSQPLLKAPDGSN